MWVWQIPKDKAERLEPSGVIFRDLIDLKKNIKPLYELEKTSRSFRGRKEHLNRI